MFEVILSLACLVFIGIAIWAGFEQGKRQGWIGVLLIAAVFAFLIWSYSRGG